MSTNQSTNNKIRQNYITGAALVLIGLFLFAGQFIKAEWLGLTILPGLGAIFLAWGLISRNFGLIIPGGILSGLGAGILLIETRFTMIDEVNKGGVVMLSFAAGWLLITLLSGPVSGKVEFWPLIPGAIIGLAGGALLTGGMALEVLNLAGKSWPLGLIVVGLYLILWRKGFQSSRKEE